MASQEKKNLTARGKESRTWISRLRFIITAAGASIGLGNLQKFPQLVAMHGGGAFVYIYICCVVLFGWPLMMAEMSLGRATKTDPIRAFGMAHHKNTLWRYVGLVSIVVAFSIFSYYIVSCAWILSFMFSSMSTGRLVSFNAVTAYPSTVLPWLIGFHFLVTMVVLSGAYKSVEQFSMAVMPLLFIMQGILIVKIISLKESWYGIRYYLVPDFSQLRREAFLAALTQAFFSLCVGEAVLLTYGSYAPKEEDLPLSAGCIALLDTTVAILGGFIIIPAMIISGQPHDQGIGLVYNTLFAVFDEMPGGRFFLVLYFFILAIAGFTTCISLLDITSYTVCVHLSITQKVATTIVSFTAFLFALPSLYSKGGSLYLSQISFWGHKGFYDIMDFMWGSVGMLVCGWLVTIFVGWIWGVDKASKELSAHSSFFDKIAKLWSFHLCWVAPFAIVYMFKTLL